jgi:hypothetical protein
VASRSAAVISLIGRQLRIGIGLERRERRFKLGARRKRQLSVFRVEPAR